MKLSTSYSPDGLTGAPASTHNPQIVRDTMLDAWRSRDLTHFAMFETRKDVDLPNHVSMRLKPADWAAIEAPPGFVSRLAVRTSLRTVVFVYQFNFDAFRLRF